MMVHRRILAVAGAAMVMASGAAWARQPSPSDMVDPFLGAESGGNVFVGPTLPYGMAKPGPDVYAGENDRNSGWAAKGPIKGFSQTHVSGTGGGAKYGNILVQPTSGSIDRSDYFSERNDEASRVGRYRVRLTRYDIGVELTAARRTALYQFTYPAGRPANVLFDLSKVLVSYAKAGEGQLVTASDLAIVSPSEVSGYQSVTGGWNKQTEPYTVYFYAVLDQPASSWGVWDRYGALPGKTRSGAGAATGGWVSFARTDTVKMKIGISYVSVAQAKQNALSEIDGFDLAGAEARTAKAWDDTLAKVEISGETPQQAQMFYTALYHTMLMPTDRSGENPLWTSSEPYYDDYYAIWDTFRSAAPLLTLIAPERARDQVRSLIDIYRHEGWLPDARSGNSNGRTQGGSNAEFLITDGFVKGMTHIDWETALKAELNDAETPPADPIKQGRGGLDDWKSLGFVSVEGGDRPGSRTMEYAADDFELALLAQGMGHEDLARTYFRRSANWKKLWDKDLQDGGVRGFVRPRHRDGSWLEPYSVLEYGSWGSKTFYEGNAWTYSLFVPQDVAGLIRQAGGEQAFVDRLDAFFTGVDRYDVGNEPGFLSPYLYIWAGRPDRTAERVRQIIAAHFGPGLNGMPFNDDSGAMSSWYAFGQMGIFPNAGQAIYLIGSPGLPHSLLHLQGGKTFEIEARNLSPANIYVVAAELNGKPLTRAWLRHAEIARGGKLVLIMAAKPGPWAATGPRPPSSSVQ